MNKKKYYPIYFVLPALLLYLTFFLLPGFTGIYYSFTDWSSFKDEINFIGIENYKNIFTSSSHYTTFIGNTLIFTVVSNIVKIIPSFFLALLLNQKMRGKNLYRTIFYFPSVLPFLAIGLIFKSIYHPSTGLLNTILETIGLSGLKHQWLADPNVVWGSIFAVDSWRGIGYIMTIFMAGLQAIPEEYYEAAKIDGANVFQQIWNVIIPLMIPSITINVTFGITYGLKVFDIIYVLTNGGPGRTTEVLATSVFREFSNGNYGISSALNAILFVFMAIIGCVIVTQLNKKVVEL